MQVTPIQDHVAQAQARLLEQLKSKPRLLGLVAALVGPLQTLEEALFACDAGRQLAKGTGAQLDALGTLVGVLRSGLPDETYRALLYGTLAKNHSEATWSAVVSMAQNLFAAQAVYLATHLQGGALGLGLGNPQVPQGLYPMLCDMLQHGLAAGVSLDFLVTFDAENGALAMDGPYDWVYGLGHVDFPDLGGTLGDLIYQHS